MASIKDRLSVMTVHYQQNSLGFALDSVAENGFSRIELWGAEPHYYGCMQSKEERAGRIAAVNDMLKQRGLTVSAFAPEQLRIYPINIASPIEYIQRWSEKAMMDYLEDTVSFGAHLMELLPGWEFLDQVSRENYDRAIGALRRIVRRAEELGVTCYISACDVCECSFATGLKDISQIIRDVGSPSFKACLDLAAARDNRESIEDWVKACGLPALVRLSDGDPSGYIALGHGSCDLAGELAALEFLGYQGGYSLIFNNPDYYSNADYPTRVSAAWLRSRGYL